MIKVKLDDRRLQTIPAALQRQAEHLVSKTAYKIEARMKNKIMTGPWSGRLYKIGKDRYHQASAPGEPPATDTGNLVNSIEVEKVRPLTRHVNVHAEYAPYLEYGTARMAARPFLQPSFEEERNSFTQDVGKLIAQARAKAR